MPVPASAAALAEGVLLGRVPDVARAISWAESADARFPELLAALFPKTGRARVTGLTGSPGAGKSTLTAALARRARARGRKVGIVAVDPSSPFSGGAILGDRIRMQAHATDDGELGSTATIPTLLPSRRQCAVSRSTSDDLPAPGGPVTPATSERPACGKSAATSGCASGASFSTRLMARATARVSPARTPAARRATRSST